MKFSVLMSIYVKEKAEYLRQSLESIWDKQSIQPDEIVLVLDGPLTKELSYEVELWKKKIANDLKIVTLENNLGIGDALNAGLKSCRNNLVARMDTDDISVFDRFEKQLNIFKEKNIDICGSWVDEFDEDFNTIISTRRLPESHNSIIKFAKYKCPLNHPSVMFKKDVIEKVGGYKKMMWFEDYYLWVRLIQNGFVFYNIQEPLVKMRSGYSQLARRSGLKYIASEYRMLKTIYQMNFINKIQFFLNLLVRSFSRVMPKYILKKIYSILRK